MSARTGPKDYDDNPNAIQPREVKLYGAPEIVIEVLLENGIRPTLVKPERNADFQLVKFECMRSLFHSMRLEWCRRLAVSTPAPIKPQKPTIDLFA